MLKPHYRKKGGGMEPNKIASEIKNLSVQQKIVLVQDVWDSIAMENGKLPIQEWQKMALDIRYKEYKQGKLAVHDWQDVHNDLREKYK
jgi:putative addiction module component (TIGR02574 family)